MKRDLYLLFLSICVLSQLAAQRDSVQLDEIMVTATKTDRLLSSVPLPFQIITKQQIQNTGGSRLQDILSEQAGLNVVSQVNGLGNGLQLQGLNPDYTMILIDGEPVIGRYTGSLELSRISIHNVKKIEIVKGPSSSLYGSEALAGVVNIITNNAAENKINASVKYASRQSTDLSLSGQFANDKWRFYLFGNRFGTQGYDLSPDVYGQTVSPFSNYTIQSKLAYEFSAKSSFNLNMNYFTEFQTNAYHVISGRDSIKVDGTGRLNNFSFNPYYTYKLTNKTNVVARIYSSIYQSETELFKKGTGQLHYSDAFKQTFLRPEIQSTCYFNKKQKWTAGAGTVYEIVNTSRYGDLFNRYQDTYYGFLQHEWDPVDKLNIVSGVRYDYNSSYHSQWSPKLAVQYNVVKHHSFKASVGTGFKAPDFRQLYFNFNNAAAAYAVFGSDIVVNELHQLEKDGRLLAYLFDTNLIGSIAPEISFAINFGTHHEFNSHLNADINFFRNNLHGLIETRAVALTTDQRTIYSYSNINRAYTQGIELNVNARLNQRMQCGVSYQFLDAKDRAVIEDIKNGLVYGRDPVTLESYRISKKDYFGLTNRSKHNTSIKLDYHFPKQDMNISARLLYHGKFGVTGTAGNVSGISIPSSDINGNNILDRNDRFIDGYFLFNLTVSKIWKESLTLQLGADNLFNYKNPTYIPNQIGRHLFITLLYQFKRKKS
ncbi:MAG: TonB-dependent receptor [Saprospiraceae bacterium]|nr:TonB-dependent receptor [Candidatus Defluviibacterium haderslevense]